VHSNLILRDVQPTSLLTLARGEKLPKFEEAAENICTTFIDPKQPIPNSIPLI
jgi:hypothetical protein